jgi:hypothetical protein
MVVGASAASRRRNVNPSGRAYETLRRCRTSSRLKSHQHRRNGSVIAFEFADPY